MPPPFEPQARNILRLFGKHAHHFGHIMVGHAQQVSVEIFGSRRRRHRRRVKTANDGGQIGLATQFGYRAACAQFAAREHQNQIRKGFDQAELMRTDNHRATLTAQLRKLRVHPG